MKTDDLAEWLLNHPDQLAALRTLYPQGARIYRDPYDGTLKAQRTGEIRYAGSVWVDADNPKPPQVSYVNVYNTGDKVFFGDRHPTIGKADGMATGSPNRVGMIAVYDDGIEIVRGAR